MCVDSFTLPPRGEKPNNYPSLYISFVLLQNIYIVYIQYTHKMCQSDFKLIFIRAHV